MITEAAQEAAGLRTAPYQERCQVLTAFDGAPADLIPVVAADWLLYVRQCPNLAVSQVEGICEVTGHFISRLDCGCHDPEGLCGYCADTKIVSRVRMVPVREGGRDEH